MRNTCVAATAANSGGYAVLRTFAHNYIEILCDFFADEPRLVNAVIRRHCMGYLLNLLWQYRFSKTENFFAEDDKRIFYYLQRRSLYWLVLLPVWQFPKFAAWPSWVLGRIACRILRTLDLACFPRDCNLSL